MALVVKYFSYMQYVDAFRRYSRSNSKVSRKRSEFWTFFSPSQILGGKAFPKLHPFYHPASRHVPWKKFCEDIATSPEVIRAHMLNFRPNFKFLRIKFFSRGPPSEMWCALASLGQSVTRVKKFEGAAPPKGRNVVSRKMSA